MEECNEKTIREAPASPFVDIACSFTSPSKKTQRQPRRMSFMSTKKKKRPVVHIPCAQPSVQEEEGGSQEESEEDGAIPESSSSEGSEESEEEVDIPLAQLADKEEWASSDDEEEETPENHSQVEPENQYNEDPTLDLDAESEEEEEPSPFLLAEEVIEGTEEIRETKDDDGGEDAREESEGEESANTEDDDSPSNAVMDAYAKMLEDPKNEFGMDAYTKEDKLQLELIKELRKIKAPLRAFDSFMKFCRKASDINFDYSQAPMQRTAFMKNLMEKAKTKPLVGKEKTMVLPGSGATIKMVYHSAPAMIASLLSDPELNQDESLLFRNRDPFSPPLTAKWIWQTSTPVPVTGRHGKTSSRILRRKSCFHGLVRWIRLPLMRLAN